MTNKEVLDLAGAAGVAAKAPSSSLQEAYADMLRRRAEREGLTRDEQPEEAKPVKKAAKKKAAAQEEDGSEEGACGQAGNEEGCRVRGACRRGCPGGRRTGTRHGCGRGPRPGRAGARSGSRTRTAGRSRTGRRGRADDRVCAERPGTGSCADAPRTGRPRSAPAVGQSTTRHLADEVDRAPADRRRCGRRRSRGPSDSEGGR